MTYIPQTWANNDPSTPLSAARLNYMEAGIASATSLDIDGGNATSIYGGVPAIIAGGA